ncbi:MAG TPA: NAD(P)-dependent oxidoreductase [Xanthobacteraceae bacterium]|jgi:D-3-phosphoglycerate dehydrogenase|nr:NAD(P)-dependent oxidoreductase [Xanthobacteraceae bacterium]
MTAFQRLGIVADHVNRHPAMRREVLNIYPNAKFPDKTHRFNEDELIAFLQGCDAAIIGFESVTERVLSALPDLKIISKYGNGCETFDFDAMKRHGVRFGYTWGVNKLAVAELALGFMLMGLRYVMPLNAAMRAGERPGIRNGKFLTGRVVGIHGCGHIGKEVVRLLAPFGCRILACDIKDYADFYKQWNVTPVSFDELAARSEVLTLHLPKTRQTLGLYSRDVLARLQPGCVLVNTCRGGIVDEDALFERLEAGALMAACFDVFAIEPAQNDRLLRHPLMLAAPHIGASTEETRLILVRAAISGLTNNRVVEPEEFYGV